MPPPRKPAGAMPPMESRAPHSIRFNSLEWSAICLAARARALEPAVFVRMLALYALSIASAPALVEAPLGIPPQMLAGSQGMRRF